MCPDRFRRCRTEVVVKIERRDWIEQPRDQLAALRPIDQIFAAARANYAVEFGGGSDGVRDGAVLANIFVQQLQPLIGFGGVRRSNLIIGAVQERMSYRSPRRLSVLR